MLEMRVFLPEDHIIRQGDEGREMFFIATGDCVVTVKDTHREESVVRMLGRGNFFGVTRRFNGIRKYRYVRTVGELHQSRAKTIVSLQDLTMMGLIKYPVVSLISRQS